MKFKRIFIILVLFFGVSSIALAEDLSEFISMKSDGKISNTSSSKTLRFDVYDKKTGKKIYTGFWLCPNTTDDIVWKGYKKGELDFRNFEDISSLGRCN